MKLVLDESAIIWPGLQKVKPEGFMIPTHLKVLTIEEKPFVYVRTVKELEDKCDNDEIPCPYFNATEDGKNKQMFVSIFVHYHLGSKF